MYRIADGVRSQPKASIVFSAALARHCFRPIASEAIDAAKRLIALTAPRARCTIPKVLNCLCHRYVGERFDLADSRQEQK